MKFLLSIRLTLTLIAFFSISTIFSQVTTFTYSGAIETYVVPEDITGIRIEVRGAQGGGGFWGDVEGGEGAIMIGDFEVTPGDELQILVGGQGLDGIETGQQGGGSGGGGSYVVDESDNPMIIAGGGGGALSIDGLETDGGPGQIGTAGQDGGTEGGAGGMDGNGGTTWPWPGWHSGTGGGGFDTDGSGPSNGDTGSYGTVNGPGIGFLNGGAGGAGGSLGRDGGFGGGGASGFTGGGGGGYSGGGSGEPEEPLTHSGGGGGSYNDGTDQDNTEGGNTGHGEIIITPLCFALTVTVSDYTICLGDEITLEAESGYGGIISWDAGIENGVPFAPDEVGFIDYTATSSEETDCDAVVTITVFAAPDVVATVDTELICSGDEIILSGEGADSYEWDLDVVDGEPFIPEVGTTTYTVVGETGGGCEGTDEITINVFESPTVVANASDVEICFGESVVFTGSGADIYEWSPDGIEDGVAHTPDESGSAWYHLIGYDSFGCSNMDSIAVFVNEEIVIAYDVTDELVGADGGIEVTVTGGTPSYSFDWDNDETDDFDDAEDLTGLVGGTYILVVKDDVGCTATVTVVVGSSVGVEELSGLEVKAYPNPTNSFFTIELAGPFNYELTDVNGKFVAQGTAINSKTLDLNEQAHGVYLVKVITEEGSAILKVIHQ